MVMKDGYSSDYTPKNNENSNLARFSPTKYFNDYRKKKSLSNNPRSNDFFYYHDDDRMTIKKKSELQRF